MRICFAFEGLFPATDRTARHVEALARRFQVKEHEVTVVTTAHAGEKDPEDLAVLRLPHSPGKPHDKDARLQLKSVSRFLKEQQVAIVFAESLTPLSGLAVKAANSLGVPGIVRVLADRGGIVHGFSQGRRTSPRVVQKKIATLLEHASVVAASSERCRELVSADWAGPVHVIEKCVDLNVFRSGRTTRRDMETFLQRFGAVGRRILLYAREHPRESTPRDVFPMLPPLREYAADVLFLVAGEMGGAALVEDEDDSRIADLVHSAGPLDGRDLFAAYDAASMFLVPPASRASGRELLEAMAMGCAVACFEETAAAEEGLVIPGETGIVLPRGDPLEAARILGELLQDERRLAGLGQGAQAIARRHDLDVAIDQVENLAVEVLGVSTETQPAGDEDGAPPDEPGTSKETSRMAKETKSNGAPRESGEGARRGRRRRSRSEPAEKAERPAAEETTEEQPVAATATDDGGDEGYEGVQFVGEDEGAKRRARRRRGRRGRTDSEVEELGASAGIDVLEVRGDRQRRRDWGIEPGLTLKDLLPFLRPPKSLLIVGASTGSGHARVAASLSEAFKGLDRNISVRQVDLLDHLAKSFRAPHVRTTLEDLSRCPALFGTPFETTPAVAGDALPDGLDELREKVFDAKLDEQIVDKRPDWLICTHWLPLKHLEQLKAEERLTAEVVAVISDPAAHDLWVSDAVSQYLVPDDLHRTFLLKRGVDAGDVTVVGIPVSPSFQRPVDREAVLSELGIMAQHPVVLLRPGGIGATERIVAAVQRILDLGPAHNLLVVAGKNDKLREDVEALAAPEGCTVRAFGFVQNIRDLMGIADLLVSRASPHTVAEALAAGLPMILLRPAPGMEDQLADRLLRRRVALKASSEDDLDALLRDLLKNRRRLRELQEAARANRRADAATAAVDRIARVVR